MIPARDVLLKLEHLRHWQPDNLKYQTFVARLTDDIRLGRFYVPGRPRQDVLSTVLAPGLSLRAAFILRVMSARPFKFEAISPRFNGRITRADIDQFRDMLNLFTDGLPLDQLRPVDLDHLPVPAAVAGILFTGFRRGEFEPVAWVNAELTEGEFAIWMQLSLVMYETMLDHDSDA